MFATLGNLWVSRPAVRESPAWWLEPRSVSWLQVWEVGMHDDLYAMQMLCCPHGEPVDSSRIPETFESRPQRRRGPNDLCHYALPYISASL